MNFIEWLDNEQLLEMLSWRNFDLYEVRELEQASDELERRLKLSGFFDMPLEFYLRELGSDFDIFWSEDASSFLCLVSSNIFFEGKTALEAAKAAHEWKNSQK